MNSGTRRIVAIDYDPTIGQRLRTAFQEPEYDFHWFADGREALGRLHDLRPDVIVCDLMLPGLDGRAVLDSVRRSPALRNVPFLVLSGVRSEATIRATLDAGAQAFLVKPCPISQLKQTIRKVLEEVPPQPDTDPGDVARRADSLRLIATGGPLGAAAHGPADTVRLAAGEAPIVYEGRVSTLDLDGTSYQVQTVAEGAPEDVAITTTVTSAGQTLRRAQSRHAGDDPKTLKELLDAQHGRALDATRQLHAQGRLAGPPVDRTREVPTTGEAAATAPPAEPTADPSTAPAGPAETVRIVAAPRTPRAKTASLKPVPPPSATDTVVLRPPPAEAPHPPDAHVPRKRPEPAPPALDTVLLESEGREFTSPEREFLTELQAPPRRTIFYYLFRAAALVVALGVLFIILEGPSDLLEGPSDTGAPESAEVSTPESAAPLEPTSPSASPGAETRAVPSAVAPSAVAPSAAAPSAVAPSAVAPSAAPPSAAPPSAAPPSAAPPSAAPPKAVPTNAPRPSVVASATPATTPAVAPTVAPTARPSAAPPAKPAARPSPPSTPAPVSAQERNAETVRLRLQLAQALYEKGSFDEARASLNEVFKLAPADAQARQLAARLERSVAGMAPFAGADGAPEEDHQAVLALLGRYETALENGDVRSLQAVWPSVDPEAVRERRQSLRSWELSLRLIDLEVTGDRAVALCVSYDNMVTAEGERIENSSRANFHLRRTNGAWLIEAVK
jgi:CheY-like chemotaxis protein